LFDDRGDRRANGEEDLVEGVDGFDEEAAAAADEVEGGQSLIVVRWRKWWGVVLLLFLPICCGLIFLGLPRSPTFVQRSF
jgi:hypothetical protein